MKWYTLLSYTLHFFSRSSSGKIDSNMWWDGNKKNAVACYVKTWGGIGYF